MAGHSHFANIKHKKAAQDIKKGKLFTKIQREIIVAITSGSPDPTINTKLQNAIAKARYLNLPKDKIENIIKKYSSGSINESYENIRYNISAKYGISLIIECLTDNKNRTAGEVRAVATKYNGNLVETGSLEFNFEKVGVITCQNANFDEIFEISMKYDVLDVIKEAENICILLKFENMHKIYEEMKNDLKIENSMNPMWQPHDTISISQEQQEYLETIINVLEDLDDVQDVYHNIEL